MISGIQNIWRIPELRARILFTFGMLAVYRVGCVVVTPGINSQVIRDFFAQMSGTVFGLMNLFSGGAMEQLSIFALGIMPYISATIIFQLLTVVIPALEALKKEGEQGQKKINQWSRYATIVLALFQSMLIAFALEGGQFGEGAVLYPGWGFRIVTMVTLTSGTAFIMWLGEQVTERGIGNGISLIIFSGIVAGLPGALAGTLELGRTGTFGAGFIILLLVLAVVTITIIVFVERAQRRIIVQYPKRQVGNKMFGGESSHIPLKLNTAGVIPPIFASSLLLLPMTVAGFSAAGDAGSDWISAITAYLGRGQPLYLFLYAALVIFFAFFYTAVVFNPIETADNLKKYGGFVPGIRPGKNTADFLDYILTRLTVVGSLYLACISIMPEILISKYSVPFYLGGTSLLIVVTVTMDTVAQVQSHLLAHQYEGLIKKSKLRGRRG